MASVSACLNIMRRMPPSDIDTNLSGLVSLVPDSTEELLQRIDQVAFVCVQQKRHNK